MNRWPGYVIAYIDMLLNMVVIGMIFMVVDIQINTFNQKPVCVMVIDIEWSAEYNMDVDLWAAGPDKLAVGYSAKGNTNLYIGADDRGYIQGEKHNDERICARVIYDGEYIVNIHMFTNALGRYPVPVKVEVAVVNPENAKQEIIVSKIAELHYYGEELTVARFSMKDGKLVPDSLYDLSFKLRGASNGRAGR